jgi:hypothetical protein
MFVALSCLPACIGPASILAGYLQLKESESRPLHACCMASCCWCAAVPLLPAFSYNGCAASHVMSPDSQHNNISSKALATCSNIHSQLASLRTPRFSTPVPLQMLPTTTRCCLTSSPARRRCPHCSVSHSWCECPSQQLFRVCQTYNLPACGQWVPSSCCLMQSSMQPVDSLCKGPLVLGCVTWLGSSGRSI